MTNSEEKKEEPSPPLESELTFQEVATAHGIQISPTTEASKDEGIQLETYTDPSTEASKDENTYTDSPSTEASKDENTYTDSPSTEASKDEGIQLCLNTPYSALVRAMYLSDKAQTLIHHCPSLKPMILRVVHAELLKPINPEIPPDLLVAYSSAVITVCSDSEKFGAFIELAKTLKEVDRDTLNDLESFKAFDEVLVGNFEHIPQFLQNSVHKRYATPVLSLHVPVGWTDHSSLMGYFGHILTSGKDLSARFRYDLICGRPLLVAEGLSQELLKELQTNLYSNDKITKQIIFRHFFEIGTESALQQVAGQTTFDARQLYTIAIAELQKPLMAIRHLSTTTFEDRLKSAEILALLEAITDDSINLKTLFNRIYKLDPIYFETYITPLNTVAMLLQNAEEMDNLTAEAAKAFAQQKEHQKNVDTATTLLESLERAVTSEEITKILDTLTSNPAIKSLFDASTLKNIEISAKTAMDYLEFEKTFQEMYNKAFPLDPESSAESQIQHIIDIDAFLDFLSKSNQKVSKFFGVEASSVFIAYATTAKSLIGLAKYSDQVMQDLDKADAEGLCARKNAGNSFRNQYDLILIQKAQVNAINLAGTTSIVAPLLHQLQEQALEMLNNAENYTKYFRDIENWLIDYTIIMKSGGQGNSACSTRSQKTLEMLIDEMKDGNRRSAIIKLFGETFFTEAIKNLAERRWASKVFESLKKETPDSTPQNINIETQQIAITKRYIADIEKLNALKISLEEITNKLKNSQPTDTDIALHKTAIKALKTHIDTLLKNTDYNDLLDPNTRRNLATFLDDMIYVETSYEIYATINQVVSQQMSGNYGAAEATLNTKKEAFANFFADPRTSAITSKEILELSGTVELFGGDIVGQAAAFLQTLPDIASEAIKTTGLGSPDDWYEWAVKNTLMLDNYRWQAMSLRFEALGQGPLFKEITSIREPLINAIIRGVYRIPGDTIKAIAGLPAFVFVASHAVLEFYPGFQEKRGQRVLGGMVQKLWQDMTTKPLENGIAFIGSVWLSSKVLGSLSIGATTASKFVAFRPAIRPYSECASLLWNKAKMNTLLVPIQMFAWNTPPGLIDLGQAAFTAKALATSTKRNFAEPFETALKWDRKNLVDIYTKLNAPPDFSVSVFLDDLLRKKSESPIHAVKNLNHINKEVTESIFKAKGIIYGSTENFYDSLLPGARAPHDLDVFIPENQLELFIRNILSFDKNFYSDGLTIRHVKTEETVVDTHILSNGGNSPTFCESFVQNVNEKLAWPKLLFTGDASELIRKLTAFDSTNFYTDVRTVKTPEGSPVILELKYIALSRKLAAIIADSTLNKPYRLGKDLYDFYQLVHEYEWELKVGTNLKHNTGKIHPYTIAIMKKMVEDIDNNFKSVLIKQPHLLKSLEPYIKDIPLYKDLYKKVPPSHKKKFLEKKFPKKKFPESPQSSQSCNIISPLAFLRSWDSWDSWDSSTSASTQVPSTQVPSTKFPISATWDSWDSSTSASSNSSSTHISPVSLPNVNSTQAPSSNSSFKPIPGLARLFNSSTSASSNSTSNLPQVPSSKSSSKINTPYHNFVSSYRHVTKIPSPLDRLFRSWEFSCPSHLPQAPSTKFPLSNSRLFASWDSHSSNPSNPSNISSNPSNSTNLPQVPSSKSSSNSTNLPQVPSSKSSSKINTPYHKHPFVSSYRHVTKIPSPLDHLLRSWDSPNSASTQAPSTKFPLSNSHLFALWDSSTSASSNSSNPSNISSNPSNISSNPSNLPQVPPPSCNVNSSYHNFASSYRNVTKFPQSKSGDSSTSTGIRAATIAAATIAPTYWASILSTTSPSGPPGPTSNLGTSGPPGPTSNLGTSGPPSGPPGPTSNLGTSGPPSGPPGPTSNLGTSGPPPGTSGPTSNLGTSGTSGTSCPSGFLGSTGLGTSGTSTPSGSSRSSFYSSFSGFPSPSPHPYSGFPSPSPHPYSGSLSPKLPRPTPLKLPRLMPEDDEPEGKDTRKKQFFRTVIYTNPTPFDAFFNANRKPRKKTKRKK